MLAAGAPPVSAQPAPPPAQDEVPAAPIEPAVVALEVTQQGVDWYSPWQAARPQVSSGSGFLIAAGRVMTNAHVVSDARQIIVRRHGDNRPYFARVEFIAHDGDLATLRVDDPEFSRGVTPLELGPLPSLLSRVRTYGYPAGGDALSRTEGVVSRVQFVTYLHSGADAHVAVQTDAAINPGNSGGPVLQDGKVVGVAFQTSTRLSDVGFFIPTPVVQRFLADVGDGRYDGYAELGVATSSLINPAYRRRLGLADDRHGVVVDRVVPGSSADGHLRSEDAILAVEGVPVRADGSIDYFGHSLNFEQMVEEKQLGEPLRLTVWRQGRRVELRVVLRALPNAERMRSQFDAPAPYFIHAGLVFMPLNHEYLKTFGNYWENADRHLLHEHFFAHLEREQADPGAVVLGRVLPHRVNGAYSGLVNSVVASLNGVPVHTLADLERGLAARDGRFHRFLLKPGEHLLVLEAREATAAHPEILRTYGIPRDRYLP
jgi:S1-C subfamily serine protease